MENPEKKCFVIRPIGEDGTDARRNSDERYKYLIKPACEARGYNNVFYAADGPSTGMITHDVVQHTIEADMVVADLVGQNPNVFYELSLRHAIRKPYACIADKIERVPFDTSDCRAVFIHSNDRDFLSSEGPRERLESAIEAAEAAGTGIRSPISMSIDLLQLGRGSELDRAVRAAVVNSEHIMKMLGGIDQPIRFKIYEMFENFCTGFELSCLEDFTNYVTQSSELDREDIVKRIHASQYYVRDAVQKIQSELQGIVVKYLREVQQTL